MMKLIANTNFHNRKLAECSKTRRNSDAAAWTETAKEKPVFRIW
jgi:hypothetical protein